MNTMEKQSKIYVAGHRGLVGSAIWNNLQQKGYSRLLGRTHAELDLLDQQAVARFFHEEKPEYVVLSAARVGGIVANNTYRGQFIYENLQIQNNVIHQSYLHGVKKLLFLGSTCIYPREAPQPMPEDCLLSGPLEYTNEPYAIAKIAGIKMCESYNLQYGTNFIAVMPTNLYGPNDNFDLERSHVLPALLRKIYLGRCLEENNWEAVKADFQKRPVEGVTGVDSEKNIRQKLQQYGVSSPSEGRPAQVEIWGTGAPLREFLWSEEMADAAVFLMEHVDFTDLVRLGNPPRSASGNCLPGRETAGATHINIGTGREISIRALAELIKNIVGFNGELVFNASKPDGTLRKLTDVRKLHSLGWKHRVELNEGIAKLYDWYVRH